MSMSRTRRAGGRGLRLASTLQSWSKIRNRARLRSLPQVESLEGRALLTTILVNTATDGNDPAAATISLREAIEISNGTLAVASLSATAHGLVSGTANAPAPI